MIALQIIV